MKRVQGESKYEEKGERGLAIVTKVNETNYRIDFDGGSSFNVKGDVMSKNFPWGRLEVGKKKQVSATMNKAGDKPLFINPASGEFEMKLQKFVAKEGQEPVAETRPGKKGKPYKQFEVILEITDGAWKGTSCWKPFYPNFAADEDGFLAVSGSGSGSDALYDFLEVTGVSKHQIKYSENPLPEIEKIALAEGQKFKGIIVKGWVDTLVGNFGDDGLEDYPTATSDTPTYAEPTVTTHPALDDNNL